LKEVEGIAGERPFEVPPSAEHFLAALS